MLASVATTTMIEPAWKMVLSNKGILPLLWEMFPDHPNLLPAFFEDDPNAAELGASFVRKPLYSREGANVAIACDLVVAADGGRVRAGRMIVGGNHDFGEFVHHPATTSTSKVTRFSARTTALEVPS